MTEIIFGEYTENGFNESLKYTLKIGNIFIKTSLELFHVQDHELDDLTIWYLEVYELCNKKNIPSYYFDEIQNKLIKNSKNYEECLLKNDFYCDCDYDECPKWNSITFSYENDDLENNNTIIHQYNGKTLFDLSFIEKVIFKLSKYFKFLQNHKSINFLYQDCSVIEEKTPQYQEKVINIIEFDWNK